MWSVLFCQVGIVYERWKVGDIFHKSSSRKSSVSHGLLKVQSYFQDFCTNRFLQQLQPRYSLGNSNHEINPFFFVTFFSCNVKQSSKLVAVLDFEYCNFTTTWSVTVKKHKWRTSFLAQVIFQHFLSEISQWNSQREKVQKNKGRVSSSLDVKKRPRRRSSFQCYCLSFAYH